MKQKYNLDGGFFNNPQKTGSAIATNILDTEHLKAGHDYNRIVEDIQQIKNPLERLPAFISALKSIFKYKNQYLLVLGKNLKMILKEKTNLDSLIENKSLTKKQLLDANLPEGGEIDNWKLAMTSDERKNIKKIVKEWVKENYLNPDTGKNPNNKEWFSRKKLDMSLTNANKIIYVFDHYKEFGLKPQDISTLGVQKVEAIIKKKIEEGDNTKVTQEEVKEYKKIPRQVIKGSTRADIVFAGVRGLSKDNKRKFWKLLATKLSEEDKKQIRRII